MEDLGQPYCLYDSLRGGQKCLSPHVNQAPDRDEHSGQVEWSSLEKHWEGWKQLSSDEILGETVRI